MRKYNLTKLISLTAAIFILFAGSAFATNLTGNFKIDGKWLYGTLSSENEISMNGTTATAQPTWSFVARDTAVIRCSEKEKATFECKNCFTGDGGSLGSELSRILGGAFSVDSLNPGCSILSFPNYLSIDGSQIIKLDSLKDLLKNGLIDTLTLNDSTFKFPGRIMIHNGTITIDTLGGNGIHIDIDSLSMPDGSFIMGEDGTWKKLYDDSPSSMHWDSDSLTVGGIVIKTQTLIPNVIKGGKNSIILSDKSNTRITADNDEGVRIRSNDKFDVKVIDISTNNTVFSGGGFKDLTVPADVFENEQTHYILQVIDGKGNAKSVQVIRSDGKFYLTPEVSYKK